MNHRVACAVGAFAAAAIAARQCCARRKKAPGGARAPAGGSRAAADSPSAETQREQKRAAEARNLEAKQHLLNGLLATAQRAYNAAVQPEGSRLPPPAELKSARDFEKKLRSVMEKAYWDTLTVHLKETPPHTDFLNRVVKDLRNMLSGIAPRRLKDRIKQQFENVDWDFMRADGTCDRASLEIIMNLFMDYVKGFQAPAKNDASSAVAKALLVQIRDASSEASAVVTAVLSGIQQQLVELTDDITAAREVLAAPTLAQEAGDHVREFYRTQVQLGLHTFAATTKWLRAHRDASGAEVNDRLICTAIIELILNPRTAPCFPESLQLDRALLKQLADETQLITLTTAILGAAGQVTRCHNLLAKPLTEEVASVLRKPSTQLPTLTQHSLGVVSSELRKFNKKALSEGDMNLLAGMINNMVTNPDDRLLMTYQQRFTQIVSQRIMKQLGASNAPMASTLQQTPLPPLGPFAVMEENVEELVTLAVRLISFNIKWAKPYYDRLLPALREEVEHTASPGNEVQPSSNPIRIAVPAS
ncbi:t-complex 11 like isoform cra b [Diplonema papillatum]|nr:t-complex 11 like isoform cra b [Diplonema papillatum]